jgi:hypothetical protein
MRQIVDARTNTFNTVVEQFIGNMIQCSSKLTVIVDGVSVEYTNINYLIA